jgi:hypothetical protein
VVTLTTLADVRVLIPRLPEDHRDDPTWRHVAAQVAQAAVRVDVVDLGIALRLALMLEGLEYEGAAVKPRIAANIAKLPELLRRKDDRP